MHKCYSDQNVIDISLCILITIMHYYDLMGQYRFPETHNSHPLLLFTTSLIKQMLMHREPNSWYNPHGTWFIIQTSSAIPVMKSTDGNYSHIFGEIMTIELSRL
jgi:hypothetical protein